MELPLQVTDEILFNKQVLELSVGRKRAELIFLFEIILKFSVNILCYGNVKLALISSVVVNQFWI